MAPACEHEWNLLRTGLLRYARRRLPAREDAEDAVQAALLAALENPQAFGGRSTFATWLTGVLKHKIADRCRRSSGEALDEDMPCEGNIDPETIVAGRQALAAIEQALGGLPPRTAHVFVLRDVIGMDTSEVCRELAISASHCSVMLHRAHARLRALPQLRERCRDAI